MANTLDLMKKEDLRQRYMSGEPIRLIARSLGVSRNTVRKTIRSEGLAPKPTLTAPASPPIVPTIEGVDLRMLDKMFALAREPGGPSQFEGQIKSMALEIAQELGVRGRVDVTRLELAVSQYLLYRRFYFQSLEVSDKQYHGPFQRSHDKAANAAVKWVTASNQALDQFNKLLRELECKAGLRGSRSTPGPVVVQQQVHVQIDGVNTSSRTQAPRADQKSEPTFSTFCTQRE